MGDRVKFDVALVSVAKLLRLPAAKVQRLLDPEHIGRMVEEQAADYARYGCFSLLQSVTLARVGEKEGCEATVIDGQHRIKAFEALAARGLPVAEAVVPVVTYWLADEAELLEFYRRINQHRPVHPLEVTPDWAAVYRGICDGLCRLYGPFFRVGAEHAGCRRPHVSLDRFMSYARRRGLAEELRAACVDAGRFVERVEALNDHLRGVLEEGQVTAKDARVYHRCTELTAGSATVPCFLGMFRQFEWVEIALRLARAGGAPLAETLAGFTLNRFEKPTPRVPKALRLRVWEKRNPGALHGGCYVCATHLTYDNMQCGHVVAHIFGGPSSFENLEPVCSACNLDMGVMDLEAYRALGAHPGREAPGEVDDD